ncbi:hypothetical protein ACYOEI_41285 [Singulisphaera rosea]
MRWKLSTATVDFTPPGTPVVTPTTPTGTVPAKQDVDVTIASVDGWTANVALPAYDLNTFNKLLAIRAYLVPKTQTPPADADTYLTPPSSDQAFPYGEFDVSPYQGGVNVPIALPQAIPPVPHFLQILLGFDA